MQHFLKQCLKGILSYSHITNKLLRKYGLHLLRSRNVIAKCKVTIHKPKCMIHTECVFNNHEFQYVNKMNTCNLKLRFQCIF